MPIYEYESAKPGCDVCKQRFEVIQAVSDEPLQKCPECDAPVHRIFSAFAPIKSDRQTLSTKNLAAKGFTQYKKAGDGHYEKTCGEGPNTITR